MKQAKVSNKNKIKSSIPLITDSINDNDEKNIEVSLTNKSKKFTKAQSKKLSLKQIAEAISSSYGFNTQTAKMLGVSYEAFKKELRSNPKLQKVVERVEEENLDYAESKLRCLIDKENVPAILFYLKCKGKKRGFIEGNEGIQAPTKPILFKYVPATKEDIQKAITKELKNTNEQ
jgi:hypothetical protein